MAHMTCIATACTNALPELFQQITFYSPSAESLYISHRV